MVATARKARVLLPEATKLEIGRLYHNREMGLGTLAQKYGVSESTIYTCRIHYRLHEKLPLTKRDGTIKADPPESKAVARTEDVDKLKQALLAQRERLEALEHHNTMLTEEVETLQKLLMTAGRAL